MQQDEVFKEYEGNHWFERNKDSLIPEKHDYVIECIKKLNIIPKCIAEVGCSNGYRLEKLRQIYGVDVYGIDASAEAVAAGQRQFPKVHFKQALLHTMDISVQYDLVICNFVLHWIDRQTFFQSICNLDKIVCGGGYLFWETFCRIMHRSADIIIYLILKYTLISKIMRSYLR